MIALHTLVISGKPSSNNDIATILFFGNFSFPRIPVRLRRKQNKHASMTVSMTSKQQCQGKETACSLEISVPCYFN